MLKITISVQEKKENKEDCTVKIEMPKDVSKGTESEKGVCAGIYQVINKALENLQK